MASTRRTVLTGVGVVTPLGTAAEFWAALAAGRSGVRPIASFDASPLPAHFAAAVENLDPRDYLDKNARKRLNIMPRTVQFAVAAARMAADDAGLTAAALEPERFGVVFGGGTVPGDLADLGPAAQTCSGPGDRQVDVLGWGKNGLPLIAPTWMLNHVPNMPACHVSILHDAQGPTNTVTQTSAGGLLALGEARRMLINDKADLFLVGGADDRVNPVAMTRQAVFSPLSCRNDAPEKASRPFDRDRDGLVVGEGGAVFVLEDREHARRRDARIYAEVVGFGAAFDRDGSGGGLTRAVRAALAEAGVGPGELDHVNAHGASTVDGDAREARGLVAALGGRTVPVFAPKSYFGCLGVGSGPVELAASLLAQGSGVLPGTLNYERPDPACPVQVVPERRRIIRRYFLKAGGTELGQWAAVVLRCGGW
jgi:3-oxoacyl-[acyl-carrier-protein] synthase II